MRLADLDPSFLWPRSEEEYHLIDRIGDAQGVTFRCPHCTRAHPDGKGVHYVLCWTAMVPPSWRPGPGRWLLIGTGYGDLSLSPSVRIESCGAHFVVRGGEVEFI